MSFLQRRDVRRCCLLILLLFLILVYFIYLLTNQLHPPPPPIDPCDANTPNSCPSGCNTDNNFLNQQGGCFSTSGIGCPPVTTSPNVICFSTTGTSHLDCTFGSPFTPVGGEVYFFGGIYYETTGPASTAGCNSGVTCLAYDNTDTVCPSTPFNPCSGNTACPDNCDTSENFLNPSGGCVSAHITTSDQCPATPTGSLPYPPIGIVCFDKTPPFPTSCTYTPPPPLGGFVLFANHTYFEVGSPLNPALYPTNCNTNDSSCFNYDNTVACPP